MPSIRPDRAAISVRRTLAAAACALAAVLLSACGGGGGDAPPAPGWQDPGVPVISPQPQDVTVVAGRQYCVSAGVSGATQSYIVGWFDGSGNYVSNNFRVCGVYPWNPYDPPNTYHQLTFQFFAYYPRSVSTAMSRQVYVTVVPYALAPRIDTPPADQTVTAPAAATFFVTASGTNLSYAWESSPDASAPFAALPETGSSLRIDSTTVAAVRMAKGRSLFHA